MAVTTPPGSDGTRPAAPDARVLAHRGSRGVEHVRAADATARDIALAHPFAPERLPERWVPGDIVLTHSPDGVFGRLIRFGQRLRYRGDQRQYAWFNHAAVVVNPFPDGRPRLVEAFGRGVVFTDARHYQPKWFAYVDIRASDGDRAEVVDFAERVGELHTRYGWVQIASIALSVLTHGRFTFGLNGTEICSSLTAKALRAGGYWWERRVRGQRWITDESYITPADLAASFHVEHARG